jgi:hypothetical protein
MKARAAIGLDARPSAAEALWYDVRRWPTFVEGFGHVAKQEGDWPEVGARLIWNSGPAGRGRVIERVTAYEVRSGQTVEIEDPRIRGMQTVSFAAREGGGCTLSVELDYELKDKTFLTPVVDALFVRRAMTDALRRTLTRFSRELAADGELAAGYGP